MIEVDSIELIPDGIGWTLRLNVPPEDGYQATAYEYAVGDAIQFHAETERTIGRWLADGPDDFHNAPDVTPADLVGDDMADTLGAAADLYRDMKRGK